MGHTRLRKDMHETKGFVISTSLDSLEQNPDDAEHQYVVLTIATDRDQIHVFSKRGRAQPFADMLQRAATNLQRRINSRKEKAQ